MPSLNGLYPGGISYEIVGSITDLVSVVSVTIFPVLTKVCLIVDDSMKFCNLLAQMIKEANLSNVKFYTALGIKKPYFYDILSGKVNPPPPDRQIAMLRLLNPKPEQIALFFDLAAQERNEVPADIAQTLKNKDLCRKLRNGIDYEKLLKNGEQKNE